MVVDIIIFIFGLGVGSFLNVVIFRYDPSQNLFRLNKLRGRSKCPNCGKTLRWFELVPVVSFLIQRRKCRGCSAKISWQYPLVEILTGLIFLFGFGHAESLQRLVGVSAGYEWIIYALAGLWVLTFLAWLLVAAIDRIHFIVPDELNVMLLALGVFVVTTKEALPLDIINSSFLGHFALLFSPLESVWMNHMAGFFAGGLFFLVIVLVTRGAGMGWGDVKLGFASGWVLGWPDMGLALMLAFIVGGILGGGLMAFGDKTMKDKLPFGPILIAGITLTVLWGGEILQGYFSIFGI